MEAMDIADAAMRERVELQHLAQNLLTDTIVVELAQKLVPELPETIANWPFESIRELLPLLDAEASRIIPNVFPDLGLSTYDCEKIFRTRIAILKTLLDTSPHSLPTWQFAGSLAGIRQKLNHHFTTLQGVRDVALHFAGLATAAVLARNDITPPPPAHTERGDTDEWKRLRAAIVLAHENIYKEVMMGN